MAIERLGLRQAVNISSTVGSCTIIDLSNFAGGVLHLPAGLTVTVVKFQVCDTRDGTFVSLYDSTATEIARTVAASRAIPLPDELFGAKFVIITSNQAAVEACTLTLKS